MAITLKLNFKKKHLRSFGALLRAARLRSGRSQLDVAREAFGYKVSHCKVSRVERAAMGKVDAHCIERLAVVLGVSKAALLAIDDKFNDRAVVAREATRRGFWFPKHRDASVHI